MSEHLQFKVSIFDAVEPVLVRPEITVDRFFQEILREFAAELDLHQQYTLLFDGKVLPPALAVGSLGLPRDALLTLSYRETGQKVWVSETVKSAGSNPLQARFVDLQSGQSIPLSTYPVLIGRQSAAADTVNVDLSRFTGSDTVSRRHAQLSFDGTSYQIIRLEKANMLMLNGVELLPGATQVLSDKDVLAFGEVALRFELINV